MLERPTGLSLDAALRDVAASNVRARLAAAAALAQPGDRIDEAVDALRSATRDSRPEVRATACLSLGELDCAAAAEALALCLDDGDAEVRQNAAIALGTLGRPEGLDPLIEALRNGPADLRFQAATSLVEIDARASYQPLLEALATESDPEVLGAIALALGAVGDRRCADALAPLLEHEKARTRLDAACALADLDDPRAIEVLAAATRHEDGSWDAVTALIAFGDAGLVALESLLDETQPLRAAHLLAAGACLRAQPDSERAKAVLASGLRARQLELRSLAVEELAASGSDWALPRLRQLARSYRGRQLRDAIDQAIVRIEERAS